MKFYIIVIFAIIIQQFNQINSDEVNSPYVDLVLCVTDENPWSCATQQTGRLLDTWSTEINRQWQVLKVEADIELNKTSQSRSISSIYNASEKPSTILRKIEIGSNLIENFIKDAANELLGRDDDDEDETDDNVEKTDNLIDTEEDKGHHGGGLLTHKKKKHGVLHTLHGLHGGLKPHGLFKPFKSSRSLDVEEPRGKKKKKKALMKLMFIATVIKGKIELLLKILSAHLQIKFFVIALVGLIINIARFWVDLRRGGIPQKVIYYENAHHQHTYEEHPPAEEWSEQPASGGYWKRSLPSSSKTSLPNHSPVASADLTYSSSQYDPHYLAYRRNLRTY